jgi:hypothetical protein
VEIAKENGFFFTYIHAKFLLKSEQNPKLCCKFANKKMCVFDKFDQIKKWNHQFAVVPLLSLRHTRERRRKPWILVPILKSSSFSSPFFISRDKKRVEVTP